MVFCSKCGEKLPENAYFCSRCGMRTKKGQEAKVSPPREDPLYAPSSQMAYFRMLEATHIKPYYTALREYLQEKKELDRKYGGEYTTEHEELKRKYEPRLIEPVSGAYLMGLAGVLSKSDADERRYMRGEISWEECKIRYFRYSIEAELRDEKPDYEDINYSRRLIAEIIEEVRRTQMLTFNHLTKGSYKRKATKMEIETLEKIGRI